MTEKGAVPRTAGTSRLREEKQKKKNETTKKQNKTKTSD